MVTRFFEDGRCQVLVGTRGLLGEGWDARRVTGLVDLTTANHADRGGPDPRPRPADRPGLAREGRRQLVGGLRLGPAPQGRQRLGPPGPQAPGLPRRRRGGDGRRRRGAPGLRFSAFAPPVTSAFAEINGRMGSAVLAAGRSPRGGGSASRTTTWSWPPCGSPGSRPRAGRGRGPGGAAARPGARAGGPAAAGLDLRGATRHPARRDGGARALRYGCRLRRLGVRPWSRWRWRAGYGRPAAGGRRHGAGRRLGPRRPRPLLA